MPYMGPGPGPCKAYVCTCMYSRWNLFVAGILSATIRDLHAAYPQGFFSTLFCNRKPIREQGDFPPRITDLGGRGHGTYRASNTMQNAIISLHLQGSGGIHGTSRASNTMENTRISLYLQCSGGTHGTSSASNTMETQ